MNAQYMDFCHQNYMMWSNGV